MNDRDPISRDADVCGGTHVVRGTRVLVRTLLASVAEGCDEDEILRFAAAAGAKS